MRRLYPEVIFDWKKITRQLAEKREVCQGYRSRRRSASAARRREPSYAVYDPATRTLCANGDGVGAIAFLDAILSMERQTNSPAPLPPRRIAKPTLKRLKQHGRLPSHIRRGQAVVALQRQRGIRCQGRCRYDTTHPAEPRNSRKRALRP